MIRGKSKKSGIRTNDVYLGHRQLSCLHVNSVVVGVNVSLFNPKSSKIDPVSFPCGLLFDSFCLLFDFLVYQLKSVDTIGNYSK